MARTAKKSDPPEPRTATSTASEVAPEPRTTKSSVALRTDTRAKPDLGKQIDQLYRLQQRRLTQQRKVDELKREEAALDAEIRTTLLDARLTAAKGKSASFSVSTEIVAQVDDWSAFHEWIAAHGAFDLLQHRVANGAYRDVLATGATPAGTRAEKILKSSIRKAGAR